MIAGGFSAGGSWALRFPPPAEIKFSVIVKGSCWLRLDGEEAVKADQGDVGLMPGRRGFVVSSTPTAGPVQDALTLIASNGGALPMFGDGSECSVLAGGASLHPASAALLQDVLPPLVIVRAASPGADTLRWIVERILEERTSTLPGASVASTQLAQLLFTQILRAHMASLEAQRAREAQPPGWLKALRDERIAPALRLMHAEPGRAFRLEELAKAAGMSRTSFAVYFKSTAGVAPLAYLAGWRIRLAEKSLREDDAPVSAIAASLGYTSESAFSHAFKRVTGRSPRDYRSEARRPEA